MTRRTRKILALLVLTVAIGVVALLGTLMYLAPKVRHEIAEAISVRTNRPVELAAVRWSLLPLRFQGEGLTIGARPGEETPLARLGEFTVEASLLDLLARPRRIRSLKVADLSVWLGRPAAPEKGAHSSGKNGKPALPIIIDQIIAQNARIEIAAAESDKPPRIFAIEQLVLGSLDLEREVPYQAKLHYQRPPGDLQVTGSFGPLAAAPEQTPYSGSYDFQEADLSVFGGIQGLLTTHGTFQGTILDTHVRGEADIPDFSVTKSGNIVPLKCRYRATVREKGAIIELDPVETTFLDSTLLTRGEVSGVPNREGRRVTLSVSGKQARVEDLVRLAVKADPPPLTGAVELDTDVDIPPGKARFIERMTAQGNFLIREGRFSSLDIQGTLEKISRVGGGESAGEQGESVVSNMQGQFLLKDARIEFSQLRFSVPGMRLDLTGSYTFEGEQLDFTGTTALERAPSEMAPPKLSKWLRIIDPILGREGAGTLLPIRISGTRTEPKFAVEFRKILR